MAYTLVEAAKYSQNKIRAGVIMEIVKDSVILKRLKFIDVVGNAYQYLRETGMSTASFYSPNDVWAEDTQNVTQVTAALVILGGDADVDNFIASTRSNITDLWSETLTNKSKAVKFTFMDNFWYGDSATNPKGFDGLHKIFAGMPVSQRVAAGSGTTPAALDLTDHLDVAYDAVLAGEPECVVMTKAQRRKINEYLRAGAYAPTMDRDAYGDRVMHWAAASLYVDDFLVTTETTASGEYGVKTGGASSSVFCLRFDTDAVVGLQRGALRIKNMGELQSKDGKRLRVIWYTGLAVPQTISCSRISGLNAALVATN